MSKKKEFVSNVTGEEWFKHNSKNWKNVINQVGVVLEDEEHIGKNDTKIILKKGSKVIIDDIRGRIKPQYRVKDINGKIWFVSALNIEIVKNKTREADTSAHSYRGGVRHDGSQASPYRYTLEKTTEEELQEIKFEEKI
tara:strand:+ start:3648 stop:4064 length:417 start_codon:yes stop_codon:yes gene_type:complete